MTRIMRLQNSQFDTYPVVLHAPRGRNKKWHKWKDRFFDRPTPSGHLPDALTVFTWNTQNKKGVFEQSMARLGMPCVVLGRGRETWQNMDKIWLLADALQEVDTPYVMAVDCYDAFVLRGLDETIDIFLGMGKKAVYSAASGFGGMQTTYDLEEVVYADQVLRHLNTGMMFGETEFCRGFYSVSVDAIPLVRKTMSHLGQKRFVANDQSVIRAVAMMFYPHVGIDHRCELFQNCRQDMDLVSC